MNRQDMLAGLMAQAAGAGGDLVTLRAIVEEASELGAERVLVRMGLADANCRRATFCALALGRMRMPGPSATLSCRSAGQPGPGTSC